MNLDNKTKKNEENNGELNGGLNNFVFFGTDSFSVIVLNKLCEAGFIPAVVVTAPDRPAGRGQKMHFSAVKEWALAKNLEKAGAPNIKILQPEKLDEVFIKQIESSRHEENSFKKFEYFIVASYGKIIPESVLKIPKSGTLNVHPSLLPLYRGATPVETAILEDNKEVGVTIMLMDKEMDHGPIIDQEFMDITEWPNKIELEKKLAEIGGALLVKVIPEWLNKNIAPQEQEHTAATFTKKIKREDGLIEIKNIKDSEGKLNIENELSAREIFLKVQALNPWPGAYFFIKHLGNEIKIKITEANFIDGKTVIKKVIPEGKKEMTFEAFKNGFLI